MGTDYDPQFSHLNVTWPEKYPFLPIKSPCIPPFAEKTSARAHGFEKFSNIP